MVDWASKLKGSGKSTDFIIEDALMTSSTGMSKLDHAFLLWADKGLEEILLEKAEGVIRVAIADAGNYVILFDKRYSREFVEAEVEAVIKCL